MHTQTVVACAHAGATTGVWAQCLREVFGGYRAGVAGARASAAQDVFAPVRDKVEAAMARA